MFHTPGLPSREREGPVAIGMDSQQALQQMLASMMQMQLDADRRREEHEERDREERRQIREEERQARKDKDAREAAEKEAWEQRHAEMAASQKELEAEATEKREAKAVERLAAEEARRKQDRLLKSLHPMETTEDLEVYLTGLEQTLMKCQVEEEEWVFYLTSNLKGKYKILMQGLTVDDEEDYQTVKGRLLEAAGFTTKEAGAILMALSTDFRRGMMACSTSRHC